jgi:hypothetical protein
VITKAVLPTSLGNAQRNWNQYRSIRILESTDTGRGKTWKPMGHEKIILTEFWQGNLLEEMERQPLMLIFRRWVEVWEVGGIGSARIL